MNEFSPTSDRSAPVNGETRDWFYRIGDRERGPMNLSQLTDLVASSGEVANEIEVRQGNVGEWVPYERIDAVTAKRLQAGRSAIGSPAPAVARESPRIPAATSIPAPPRLNSTRSITERFHLNWQIAWQIAVGVLVWAGVNVVLWNAFDPLQSQERKYYKTLTEAAQKARSAREQGLVGAERSRLAKSVLEEVKPMIADLNKSASASEPIRQHLLWAAKDQLPKLFSENTKELKECDGIFQWHMYEVGRRLGYNVSRPATSISFQ